MTRALADLIFRLGEIGVAAASRSDDAMVRRDIAREAKGEVSYR